MHPSLVTSWETARILGAKRNASALLKRTSQCAANPPRNATMEDEIQEVRTSVRCAITSEGKAACGKLAETYADSHMAPLSRDALKRMAMDTNGAAVGAVWEEDANDISCEVSVDFSPYTMNEQQMVFACPARHCAAIGKQFRTIEAVRKHVVRHHKHVDMKMQDARVMDQTLAASGLWVCHEHDRVGGHKFKKGVQRGSSNIGYQRCSHCDKRPIFFPTKMVVRPDTTAQANAPLSYKEALHVPKLRFSSSKRAARHPATAQYPHGGRRASSRSRLRSQTTEGGGRPQGSARGEREEGAQGLTRCHRCG